MSDWLIIEHVSDGSVFVYAESDTSGSTPGALGESEDYRRQIMRQRTLAELAEDCDFAAGQYLRIPLFRGAALSAAAPPPPPPVRL